MVPEAAGRAKERHRVFRVAQTGGRHHIKDARKSRYAHVVQAPSNAALPRPNATFSTFKEARISPHLPAHGPEISRRASKDVECALKVAWQRRRKDQEPSRGWGTEGKVRGVEELTVEARMPWPPIDEVAQERMAES